MSDVCRGFLESHCSLKAHSWLFGLHSLTGYGNYSNSIFTLQVLLGSSTVKQQCTCLLCRLTFIKYVALILLMLRVCEDNNSVDGMCGILVEMMYVFESSKFKALFFSLKC